MEATTGMYSVLDSKARAFSPPFLARNDYEAQRMFEDVVAKPGLVRDHAEDFALYRIGSFDAEKGFIAPCELFSLGIACDFKKSEVRND